MKKIKETEESSFLTYLRIFRSVNKYEQLEMAWKMLRVYALRYPGNFLELSMFENLLNLKHINLMPDERIAA